MQPIGQNNIDSACSCSTYLPLPVTELAPNNAIAPTTLAVLDPPDQCSSNRSQNGKDQSKQKQKKRHGSSHLNGMVCGQFFSESVFSNTVALTLGHCLDVILLIRF